MSWDKRLSYLLSFIIILCVGDVPLWTIVWWLVCCGRRMVDMKLVSHAFVANDKPRRWCVCWFCLQHKYRWKCWRNTPDTQYKATGFTHELRKLLRAMHKPSSIEAHQNHIVKWKSEWCVCVCVCHFASKFHSIAMQVLQRQFKWEKQQ